MKEVDVTLAMNSTGGGRGRVEQVEEMMSLQRKSPTGKIGRPEHCMMLRGWMSPGEQQLKKEGGIWEEVEGVDVTWEVSAVGGGGFWQESEDTW